MQDVRNMQDMHRTVMLDTAGRQTMSSVNFEGLVEHRAYAHGDAGKPGGSTSSPIASSDSMPC